MRATRRLLAAAVLLLAAGAVRAGESQSKYNPHSAFAEADTNGDGAIDREEFHARIVEVFYEADVNKDGFLSPDEEQRLTFPEDMKIADSDHDGRITVHEFLRVRYLDFEEADRNKDGVLSLDEVIVAYEGKKKK